MSPAIFVERSSPARGSARTAELANLPELPDSDGIPMETTFHRDAASCLIQTANALNLGYVGGNNFIYYDEQDHTKTVGPDFFFVKGADPTQDRPVWAVWRENGLFPHVILEILSPSTAHKDRGLKKDLYESVFTTTQEYYLVDPDDSKVIGWRRSPRTRKFLPLSPDEHGRLTCEGLNVSLGVWHGTIGHITRDWPRFYHPQGDLVPMSAEIAENERQQKEDALAELAELRAKLKEQK